jgi:hypothetical protein
MTNPFKSRANDMVQQYAPPPTAAEIAPPTQASTIPTPSQPIGSKSGGGKRPRSSFISQAAMAPSSGGANGKTLLGQ